MSLAQSTTLKKIVQTLDALEAQGLQYRIEVGGVSFGKLAGATPTLKKKRFITTRKYGSITESFKDKLSNMKSGDLVVLPTPNLPDLDTNHYNSCVAAWCTSNWGKGSYMVSKNGSSLEVLRIK